MDSLLRELIERKFGYKQMKGAIMARRKKEDQEGPVELRENDRAAEIEYRVMLARNLERNFGFGF